MTRWGSACTRRAGSSRPTVFYQECVDRRVRDAARYMVRRSACRRITTVPALQGGNESDSSGRRDDANTG